MKKLHPAFLTALVLLTATFAAASPLTITTIPQAVTTVNAGAKQQFSATTSGGGTPVVFWSVSGVGCSGFGCGNISITGGLYSAPSNIASPLAVTISAVSISDSSSSGSTSITVTPGAGGGGGISVSISPSGNLQLNTGATLPFSATVTGTSNMAVTWTAGGFSCGATCGSISPTGVYSAPLSIPRSLPVTITATSQADSTKSASVTVQLVPVVAVTMGPYNSQMTTGTTQQLSATVSGAAFQNVNWSVSCSGTSCGTVSPSGLYTSPGTAVSGLVVTVRATAQADMTKSATAAITVGQVVAVAVSPSGLSLSINAAQQYSAAVTGTSSTAVSWTVSGPGCSGAACGVISPLLGNTALYQAPGSVPTPGGVTITATLQSDSSKSGSASATIVPLSNSRFSGQYAFLFKGFDLAGPYQAAGSFTADGNGGITGGIEDINCGFGAQDPICASGPIAGQAFTGTYTLNADGRGTFSITPSGGSPTYSFTLAMESSNTKALFVEYDNNGIRGTGVIEQQTPSAFTPSALSAGYSFSLSGVDYLGKPLAAIGSMGVFVSSVTHLPVISSGVLDVNDNGIVSCFPPETNQITGLNCSSAGRPFNNFTGTYTIGSNGRGTASLSIPGFDGIAADMSVFNFSLYVISPTEFFLLSMDDPAATKNPVFSGDAIEQMVQPAMAFQPGSAVISWSGWSQLPPSAPFGTLGTPLAAVGRVALNATGLLTSAVYDINNGGAITYGIDQGLCPGPKAIRICFYALQPNLDAVLSVNAFQVSSNTQLRIMPTAVNSGFLLGMGPSVTVGKMELQTQFAFPVPFMFGSDLAVSPNATLVSGAGSFAPPGVLPSPILGNEDESLVSSFVPSVPFVGKYGPTSLPNGQGLMYLDATSAPTLDFWVVSPNRMVGLDVDTGVVPNLITFEH